jgi:hypothetical protein
MSSSGTTTSATTSSMPEKFTVQESQSWLQENLSALVGLGDTEFIQAIHDLKAAIPKKPRVSKKTPVSERADAPYNEDKCDARVWLKPGNFAGQCSCKKVDAQFLCKRHQNESEKHDGETRNGFYNKERPTHAFGDTEDDLLEWHDVVVDKPVKKTKTKTSGDRKARSCGNCGQSGHDKRKCPNASKDTSDKPMSVAELTAMLAEAKALEEKETQEKETQEKETQEKETQEKETQETQEKIDDDKTQACSNGEDVGNLNDFAEEQLEEDPPLSPKSQNAAGTGLESEEETGDSDDGEDDEEEVQTVECNLEEVPYSRSTDGRVFDDDFDHVGLWLRKGDNLETLMNDPVFVKLMKDLHIKEDAVTKAFDGGFDGVEGKIVFSKTGKKMHKKSVAAL